MTPNQLRQKYLNFFKSKGHTVIPSAAIVPENDPTTLFTGSGMQPMVPYLLGEKHPHGTRITDSQRCLRSQDIEDVGDNRHTTFFEMLGNWSLGDYFKTEQIEWIFTFLTQEVGLDPTKLFVTAFRGDKDVPKDIHTEELWKKLFTKSFKDLGKNLEITVNNNPEKGINPTDRIFYYGYSNWWSRAGEPSKMPVGEPGGPDSEIFYDFGEENKDHQNSEFSDQPCHPNCDCGRFLEIGNSVFMQYRKTEEGVTPLTTENVDFGGGFERILAAYNNDPDMFKTDLFVPIIQKIEQQSGIKYQDSEQNRRSFRVIADHMRSAVMLAMDGVFPSNKEQGYFSRRMIRRAVRFAKMIGINKPFLGDLVSIVVDLYKEPYPQILAQQLRITQVINSEEEKFRKTLNKGLKEFEKLISTKEKITGKDAFFLFETYGFPFEITQELAQEKSIQLNEEDFKNAKKSHADKSRTASVGKFKGGLADQSEKVTQYHTCTHLLNQALRQVLGDHVQQVGSNITGERLRFDFSHPDKLTDEQKKQIEQIVNKQIQADLPVSFEVMDTTTATAEDSDIVGVFGERYGDKVKVYSIGSKGKEFSKEICGGPHVEKTSKLGNFRLGKEKAIGAGKRRIYGYLE